MTKIGQLTSSLSCTQRTAEEILMKKAVIDSLLNKNVFNPFPTQII